MYFQETRHEQREWDGIVAGIETSANDVKNLIETLRVELDDARAKIEDLESKIDSLNDELDHYKDKHE